MNRYTYHIDQTDRYVALVNGVQLIMKNEEQKDFVLCLTDPSICQSYPPEHKQKTSVYLYVITWHNEASMIWPTFYRSDFQIYFYEELKFSIFF